MSGEIFYPIYLSCGFHINRLVAFLLCRGCKNVQDAEMVEFDSNLLAIMIDWIPRTLQCLSAGAFRWFFQFILYLLPHDRYSGNVPRKCFSLLVQVAKELHSRQNPYHLLLRTRYGFILKFQCCKN